MEANEEYVRQRWETIYGDPPERISLDAGEYFAMFDSWQAAKDYTIAREEEIRRRENCLVLLSCCDTEELNDQGLADWNSIIAREQAALDELRKGMRQ